jgi:hypothetical protein
MNEWDAVSPVAVVPSPKFQSYVSAVPSGSDEPAALNENVVSVSPDVGSTVNDASGFRDSTVTEVDVVFVFPYSSVTVRFTV